MSTDEKKKDEALMADLGEGPGFFKGTVKGLIAAAVVVVVLIGVFCLEKVEPWEVGLRYWNVAIPGIKAQGQVDVLEPGYNIIIPGLHQDLVTYDCSIKRLEMSPAFDDTQPDLPPLRVRTAKDQDEIDVYVTIFYHVDRGLIQQNIDDHKTESGIREAYPDNESVHESGVKSVCPNILQARLGEIMTANQFYNMTSEKRDYLHQRLSALALGLQGLDAAQKALDAARKNFDEATPALAEKKAALETAKKSTALDRDVKVAGLQKQVADLEAKTAELDKAVNDAMAALLAVSEKTAGIPLPPEAEEDGEVPPDQRLALLADEFKTLHKTYPAEPYFRDRAAQMAAAEKEMNDFFNPKGIMITAVLIWDFKFRDEIEAQIMAKVVADEKVELERALKAAAYARALWQKKVAEANAAYEAELARGRAGAMAIDAEAARYRTEKAAVGDRMILEAQAPGKGRINAALAGRGGQVYVGIEYAKILEGLRVMVLPAGGPDGYNPLDTPSATQNAQPSGAK